VTKLVGKAGDAVEGEIAGDRDTFFLAEGGDVGRLALDIDGIARVDGELFGDPCIELTDLGPDGLQPADVDVGIAQELDGAPPATVAIDGEPRLAGFVRRQRQALQ
jgi:hypothetical protein